MKHLFVAFAFIVAAFASAAEARDRTVSLRGLDLATEQGVDRAYLRLTRAVREACRAETTYPLLRLRRACERETLDSVIARVNEPTLLARHAIERGDQAFAALR